jgi:hypothetical protein
MPMTETETLYQQYYFDTKAEAEAYVLGIQHMMDFALEYCTDYTFRCEIVDKGSVEVLVFKVWEE